MSAPSSATPTEAAATPSTSRTARRALTATVVATVVAGLASLAFSKPPPVAPEHQTLTADAKGVTIEAGAPQWKYIQLATAEASPPLPALPLPARVELDESRTASVASPLAGRVEEVHVRLGDVVHKGQRLFSVRSGAFADLDREVASALGAVALKKEQHDRASELAQLKAVPEKDEQERAEELREAERSLAAARARQQSLAVVPGSSSLFWVLAPRDGTVVDLDVSANQSVAPDRDRPLLRLSSLDQVLVIADLQEADVNDVDTTLPVRILLPGGKELPGRIQHVSQVVDPHRRTVALHIIAANTRGLLRPNAFLQVVLPPTKGAQRVRVPAEAVVSEGSKSMMFVAAEDGRLQTVPVVVGRQDSKEVEIASGLAPGARYVSRGALLLLNEVDLVD